MAHPDADSNTKCLCLERRGLLKREKFLGGLKTMNWKQVYLFGRDQVEHSFKTLVDRAVRERRLEERQFVEQRTTKHRLQVIKSCVVDARSYRVARFLPLLAIAQTNWKH